MAVGNTILSTLRITRIMQAIQDVRELEPTLIWSSRIPQVDAADGEIMARFIGRVQIADLVSDDAQAVTYTTGKMTFESHQAPNIKHGEQLTQSQLRELVSLQAGGGDLGIYANYERQMIARILAGIRQRTELLRIAMLLDTFSYDRLGIKMTGVTWGAPADLKVTPAIAWDNILATPVTDILNLIRLGRVRYGAAFNRVSMSLVAFNFMIATTEFMDKARMYMAPNVSFVNMNMQNTTMMTQLAANVLGLAVIELHDDRYWQKSEAGVDASYPFLPITKVVLTQTSNDGDSRVWDFANGVTIESMVLGMTTRSSGVGMPSRGPMAYATTAEDANPPNVTYWGVQRGFPRRHLLQSSAVLTVGAFTDPIPVGEPF